MTQTPYAAVAGECREKFRTEFGRDPAVTTCAPGRVNIIGEHTDYSGGFVLPAAIPLYTVVSAALCDAPVTRVCSSTFGRQELPLTGLAAEGRFADYVAGCIRGSGLEGRALQLMIHSNLPVEAGLSSSASLLVATLGALHELAGCALEPLDLALEARRVENEFIGVPCGFMDQFAVACGQQDKALLLDCRDNDWLEVPALLPKHAWLVVYSGLRRELAAGGYKAKVEALKGAVAKVLERTDAEADFPRYYLGPEIEQLRTGAGLTAPEAQLLGHVCTENFRVHAMRHALEKGDGAAVGQLLVRGHESLSRLFGVSTKGLDGLVEFSLTRKGVAGMRLTGAGMGGSLVALVERDHAEDCRRELESFAREHLSPEAAVFPVEHFASGVTRCAP